MTIAGCSNGVDTRFRVQTGIISLGPLFSVGIDCQLESEADLQVLVELYDPAGIIRLQLVQYRGGTTPHARIGHDPGTTSLNARYGELPAGPWEYRVAFRNVSSLGATGARVRGWRFTVKPDVTAIPLQTDEVYSLHDTLEAPPNTSQKTSPILIHDAGLYWHAGDLHQHSNLSDGVLSPRELIQKNMELGHGFMAITDHQVFQQARAFGGLHLVGGAEVTTPNGHFLALGEKLDTGFLGRVSGNGSSRSSGESSDDGFARGFGECDDLGALVERLDGDGLFLVACHPAFSPWHWRCGNPGKLPFQALEIICDPAHGRAGAATDAALDLWDTLLDSGSHIVGLGGSDFHSGPETPLPGYTGICQPGDPLTFIGTTRAEPETGELLEALKAGKVSVGRGLFPGFSLFYRGREFRSGDTVYLEMEPGPQVVRVRILLSAVSPETRGQRFMCSVASMEGCLSAFEAITGEETIADLSVPAGSAGWLRLEVRDEGGRLCGFSNAIRMKAGSLGQG